MARVIEFHIPTNFRRKVTSIPPSQPERVIASYWRRIQRSATFRLLDRLWRLIPTLKRAGNAAAPQIEKRSRYTTFRELPIFSSDQRTTKAPVMPRRMSTPVPYPSPPAILPAAHPASSAANYRME
jgi:hypothetical protein